MYSTVGEGAVSSTVRDCTKRGRTLRRQVLEDDLVRAAENEVALHRREELKGFLARLLRLGARVRLAGGEDRRFKACARGVSIAKATAVRETARTAFEVCGIVEEARIDEV